MQFPANIMRFDYTSFSIQKGVSTIISQTITVKDTIKFVKIIFKIYLLYVLIFGALIFGFHKPTTDKYLNDHQAERFYGENTSKDRIVLVEDRHKSGIARIDLMERAQQTLDIAYYKIQNGTAADIFFGTILDAADRGVQVRILVDGIFHNFKGTSRDVKYTLMNHPNIQLKLYEPFNPFLPWTWNNRLHDKFIVVDNQWAMIGGRNIEDRCFLDQVKDTKIVNDRDVVIINTDQDDNSDSAVHQMKKYFDQLWQHEFSKYPAMQLNERQKAKALDRERALNEYAQTMKQQYPEIFKNPIDWLTLSLPARKITLIHNPIQRFNKEPWVWDEILQLMEQAQESIFIQSPYIVPTKNMMKYADEDNLDYHNISMLTNSLAVGPNYPGMSGYIRHRKNMVDLGINLYEYHGSGSIHGKSIMIDDRISLVGSYNLDARSTFLSTESMVVIDSEEFYSALENQMKKLTDTSLKVGQDYSYLDNPFVEHKKASPAKMVLIRALSFLAYFFDYLL
ncbi:MAG: phospholipase D family protein [Clostridia bacterium]|nr:phospholipase D family protein [Clostridia bacterium]